MKIQICCRLLVFMLAVSSSSQAVINDGTKNEPSELFVSVLDPSTSKSYYKDLGYTMADFRNQTACGQLNVDLNLADDTNYAGFTNKTGLIYNIAGFYGLKSDQTNIGQWGYVLTSTAGGSIFKANFVGIDAVRQKMQVYAFNLNPSPYDGTNAVENLSGTFAAALPGYFDSSDWGASLGGIVGGNTAGTVDQPLDFYYVTNPTGNAADGTSVKQGSWSLSQAGQLTYATAALPGTTCVGPTANAVGNYDVTTGIVTLDGKGSTSSTGIASYHWSQIDGPTVDLSSPNGDQAAFVAPTPSGTDIVFKFQLVVIDNAGLSSTPPASVTITVPGKLTPIALANASPPTASLGVQVTLDATGSNVPGGSIASYAWTQTQGPSVELQNANQKVATFTVPEGASGTLTFKLTVTDNVGTTGEATVNVLISPFSIDLVAPAVWVLGVSQPITWTTGQVGPNRPVVIQYSADGTHFRAIKAPKNQAGQFVWKPVTRHLQATQLRACVRTTNRDTPVCDTQTISVSDIMPGASITFGEAPTEWKVGEKQPITWSTAGEVGDNQIVTASYAKDGTTFKTIKRVKSKVGTFNWKPVRGLIGNGGVLKICVKPNPLVQPVCDTQEGVNITAP